MEHQPSAERVSLLYQIRNLENLLGQFRSSFSLSLFNELTTNGDPFKGS